MSTSPRSSPVEANRDQARDVMMKQWRVTDTLTREASNVTQPINAAQVVDFTFLDRARKELRGAK
ncbi:MAG TPA: hypothetical protein VH985_08610 [Candidatus Binatia bacterium]